MNKEQHLAFLASHYDRWHPRDRSYQEMLSDESGRNSFLRVRSEIELRLGREARLLDIGCGSGDLVDYLGDLLGRVSYTGIDAAERAISIARGRFPSCVFQVGDAEKLKGIEGTFDFVVSHMVFALLEDPVSALKEVSRVLALGGTFICWTPAYWRMGETEESARLASTMALFDEFTDFRARTMLNQTFRDGRLLDDALTKAFPPDSKISLEAVDLLMHRLPQNALQYFTLDMYQFSRVPDERKPDAVKRFLEHLISMKDADGLVRLRRPMCLITVSTPACSSGGE
jgi:SAM-dependent methyltransferase